MEAKKLLMVFGIITVLFGLYMQSTSGGTLTLTSTPVIVIILGLIEVLAGWKVKK